MIQWRECLEILNIKSYIWRDSPIRLITVLPSCHPVLIPGLVSITAENRNRRLHRKPATSTKALMFEGFWNYLCCYSFACHLQMEDLKDTSVMVLHLTDKKKGWVPQSMEIWVSRPLMSSARATISAFSSLRYMSRFYSLLDLPHDVPHIFLCRSRPRLTLELNLHRVDLPTLTAGKWLAT